MIITYLRHQITIGRSDNTHIDLDRSGTTQAFESAVLQNP